MCVVTVLAFLFASVPLESADCALASALSFFLLNVVYSALYASFGNPLMDYQYFIIYCNIVDHENAKTHFLLLKWNFLSRCISSQCICMQIYSLALISVALKIFLDRIHLHVPRKNFPKEDLEDQEIIHLCYKGEGCNKVKEHVTYHPYPSSSSSSHFSSPSCHSPLFSRRLRRPYPVCCFTACSLFSVTVIASQHLSHTAHHK